ncbi:hypothetical protein Tco_0737164 [Tanacetum coccineum]
MSSITAQQTKLDLELVPKEKRLEIRKCNGRLNPGKKQREPTFQVVLDALALTPCYSSFLIVVDVPEICPRVHGENFDELPTDEDIVSFFKELGHSGEIKTITDIDEDFTYQIDNRGHKKKDKMYYPRFTKVIIHHFRTKDKTISKRNKIGMHTSRDDYLINTLRFISVKEESQIYGARLPKSMKSHEMRETKAYKTYLGYATGVTPPKKARKFKKPASPTLSTIPASPEEPTRKSKRVKRPVKKSSDAPTAGVVIRETLVKSLSKKKEKMTVEKRKGIDLLSAVALTEEAQYEEVQKKSLRDFHKTHLSGSSTVTKIAPSTTKIKPSITNEGTGVKPGVLGVTEEESTKKSDQEENEEEVKDDEEEKDDESIKTPSNSTDDEDETNNESKVQDKAEGDEDEGIDYTTNQFDDDVDLSLNEPVDTDKGFIQKEGTDAEMINKTEVPVTSSSQSSDLAKIVSTMDIHDHHKVPSKQTPILITVSTRLSLILQLYNPPSSHNQYHPSLPNFASVF